VPHKRKKTLLGIGGDAPVFGNAHGAGARLSGVYVIGRGEIVTVLYSRTDWYRVRAARGEEGWVRRDDLAITELESGEPAPIPPYPDFRRIAGNWAPATASTTEKIW
jgi:hypothetical protein